MNNTEAPIDHVRRTLGDVIFAFKQKFGSDMVFEENMKVYELRILLGQKYFQCRSFAKQSRTLK